MFTNAVYYPNWRVYRNQPPSSLNLGAISHVFYAFAWIKEDGTIYFSDEWADTQMEVDGTRGCLKSFAALKTRYTTLKVILSVGGGGKGSEPFAAIAHSPALRDNFARSARAIVDSYGLDGIDIDWEHPSTAQQGADYIHLLAALRSYLPAQRYTLTTALPAGQWALQHINLAHAAAYLDLVNLMAYDFSGPWADKCGHQAQLYSPHRPYSDAAATSCHSAVTYLLAHHVPAAKILLGIPAYGRSFLGASNIGQSYSSCGGEDGAFEFRDLPRPGSHEYFDEQLGATYCIGPDGGFVSYDDGRAVAMKAGYVRQRGLAGLFYWTGTGDKVGRGSLVECGFAALHQGV
ncbi:glycoside hydrolase family 18 protein [Aulographum hederae CBS 113979]|uniref:chitinase n=1 Tax=Aulographum hederae CBS 113979 TaxID=1176131 RepID=A0A6G1GZI5_9PEZI|nr:glycoside hydrolase family 18 protein [Aulographum hederae CBS 113979]